MGGGRNGWAEGWVEEWVDRWVMCEVWVDRWVEREGRPELWMFLFLRGPSFDMVQHLLLTFPPLSVPIYTNDRHCYHTPS
jgi:hypothetical protein